MPRKPISFDLDFVFKDIFPRFTVKQFDDVTFNIKPKLQGYDYDITGMTGKIFVGVNNDVFMQTQGITVTSNNIDIVLDKNMLQKNGRAYAEIELTDSNGTITSSSFIFNIDAKVGEGGQIPGGIEGFVQKYERLISEFKSQVNSSINSCNDNVANKLNSVDAFVNTKISDFENRFNTLTASKQQDAEVIDARDGEKSLKARLDKINSQLEHIATVPQRIEGEIDDTNALRRAIKNSSTIKLSGIYYISESLEVSNIKITGDNKDSKIIMTSNNKPIFLVTGGGFTLTDCTLQYQHFQDITNNKSVCITPKENAIVDLCVVDRVSFINCYCAIKSDWLDNNKVFYSCNFSNLNISSYSHSAIYLNGGTGCYLNNIYTHNWLDYSSKIIRECEHSIYIQGYSEFNFNQLNLEWCKPRKPLFIINGMEACSGTSIHIEGVEFYNNSSIFSIISSNVKLTAINVMNNDMNNCSNINMFAINGKCHIDVDLLVERDNHHKTLSSNLFSASSTHDNLEIRVGNCDFKKFSKNSYFPTNQYNLHPIKEIDGVKYEENENGQKVIYLNSIPTKNRYLKNTKIYNTNCESGGYIGWVCVAGGYFGGLTTDITASTSQAYVNTINVSKIGELKIGDLISFSGSSREFVITNINGTTITLSQNVEVQLSNSIVTIKDPRFKGFGLIES